MGVLAPKSVHARPSARPPIDTSKKNPAWGYKFSKVFLINFLAKSGNSKHFVSFIFVKQKIKNLVTMFALHLQK